MAKPGGVTVREWFRQLRAAQWAYDDTFLARFAEVWRPVPMYYKFVKGRGWLTDVVVTTADDPDAWRPLIPDYVVTVTPKAFFDLHREICLGRVKALPFIDPEPPAFDDYRSDERRFQVELYWELVRRGAIPRG